MYRILSLLFKVLFCSLRFAARERRSKVPQAAKLLLLHLFGKSRPPPHSSSNGKLIPNDLKEKCHFIVSFSLFPSERCFFFFCTRPSAFGRFRSMSLHFSQKPKRSPRRRRASHFLKMLSLSFGRFFLVWHQPNNEGRDEIA